MKNFKYFNILHHCVLIWALMSCKTYHIIGQETKIQPINFNIQKPNDFYNGYLLWHQVDEIKEDNENISLLINGKGEIIHVWDNNLSGMGSPAHLLNDGSLIRTGMKKGNKIVNGTVAAVDILNITNFNGKVIWEYKAPSDDIHFHHDFVPLPNGNILVAIYEAFSFSKAKEYGWDINEQKKIWVDGIIEIKPDFSNGTGDIVWKWSVADHLIQDKFPALKNYGVVSEHPEKIDPNYPTDYKPKGDVRQHINSLDYNPELDQIVMSSLIYNEIWIIDHSIDTKEVKTSKGGSLLFRYGNPAAYGQGTEKDRIFLKQHDANWIDKGLPGEGNLLVHNNNTIFVKGNQEVKGRTSQIFEFSLPINEDGTYSKKADSPFKAETIWSWENPDYYAVFQGGARRLPNGNTLITDTVDGIAFQINHSGEIVAEYRGNAPTFKCFMYSADYLNDGILNKK